MLTMRRFTITMSVAAMMLGAMAPATMAGGATNQERAEAAGWGCAAAVGLPGGHCISPGTVLRWPDALIASGGTFQLRVFDGGHRPRPGECGDRLLAEGIGHGDLVA